MIDNKNYKSFFPKMKVKNNVYGKIKRETSDLIVCFPMFENIDMTKIFLYSLLESRKNLKQNIEIIVVDNFSCFETKNYLESFLKEIQETYLNFYDQIIINYVSLLGENKSFLTGFNGSVLNALGLHEGYEKRKTKSKYFFVAHSDVMFTKSYWFETLKEKIDEGYKLSCFRKYNKEDLIGHISGYIFDNEYFNKDNLNFFPLFNKEGKMILDAGDLLSILIKENNHKIFVTKNTFNKNIEIEKIDAYQEYSFDRAVNKENKVVFMHLGRGSWKGITNKQYDRQKSFDAWKESFLNTYPSLILKQ